MNGKSASLEQIQRWMQSVLMHSGGVAEGMKSPQARQHLDIAQGDLESVILPSRALDSSARLEIYVDAYFERLLECLREEFTATRFAVGDELFDALAFGYLQHYPSRSYTLNTLGEQFPKFLAEMRLHAHETPSGAAEDWPEFVIELASFERVLRDVFDGLGSEGQAVLNFEELSEISAEKWGQLRLLVAPCLRLHRFAHPVQAYWSAFKNGQRLGPPALQTTCLAISRRHFVVERRELTQLEFELLSRIARGETVGEALAGTATLAGADWKALERGVPTWFRQWTVAGFFMGCELAGARD
jgi:hypothetical protein